MGDMLVEGVYSEYRDVGVLQVPMLTIVRQGGFPTSIAGVKAALVNAPVSIAPRAAEPAAASPATVTVVAEKAADGADYLHGGSHHRMLVEFADQVTLIEAPQNETRTPRRAGRS